MGIFKKKVVKEIHDGIWGHLISENGLTVDMLMKNIRCVESKGTLTNGLDVMFVRVFRLEGV